MKRNLYAVLLAVLFVAAGLLMWQGGRVSAASPHPDSASLALLPAASTAVFGVDVDALRATPIYAQLNQARLQHQAQDQEYNNFVSQTGFDPFQQVQSVTGAAWKDGDQGRGVVVVMAAYDPSRLAGFLKQQKEVAVATYNGVELFGPAREKTGNDRGVVALLDSGTIVAGNEPAVKQVIDLKSGGLNIFTNAPLVSKINQVSVQNQVWGVTIAPGTFIPPGGVAGHEGLPQLGQVNIGRILAGLQAGTFGASVTAEINAVAEAVCANQADATTLATAANGLLAMARLMAPSKDPRAAQLLNSVQVIQDGLSVRFAARIPADLLDQITKDATTRAFVPHKKGGVTTEQHQRHRRAE